MSSPRPLAVALLLVAALTAVRVAVLFATPVELYPDEAQYWLWSRELAWGYYSKPPLIAWLIAASTALGGHAEAWVRLPAALAHGVAALALFSAGARLYGGWAGFLAALVYSLMPGVQLSAGVMTTDAPLLMFLSLALLAWTVQQQADDARQRLSAAAGLGLALGLAILSKYAALFFVLGVAVQTALQPQARRAWRGAALPAALAALAVVVTPNLLWNATHGFATVSHTADNAHWGDAGLFNPAELLDFVGAQFGVFGPIPFLVLIVGGAALALRRRLLSEDVGLLCLALPPLLIVAAQAFISRANANWAAAAYVPGAVLAGALLLRWRTRGLIAATVALQGLAAAVFLSAAISPAVAARVGADNGFKRARGWAALTREVEQAVAAGATGGGYTAVVVDDRFLFNALAYYGRDTFLRPGATPLRMWVREASPQNQAESEHPLTPAVAGRALVVSLEPDYRAEIAADFRGWRRAGSIVVPLDSRRVREATLYEAAGYARRPRDAETGLPLSVRPTAP